MPPMTISSLSGRLGESSPNQAADSFGAIGLVGLGLAPLIYGPNIIRVKPHHDWGCISRRAPTGSFFNIAYCVIHE